MPADRLVLLSILIPLIAWDLLTHGAVIRLIVAWLESPAGRDYGFSGLLSLIVGFAELVSRYRDEPWRVARLLPGLIFIGLNGVAGCLALFLMRTFPALHAPDNEVLLVMVAGFGAMVAIRTKVMTVHQPGGPDIAVGPAFVLDTMLAAINRDVDRRRALMRTNLVADMANTLSPYKYSDAHQFLLASLAAFQNMDEASAKKLRSDLEDLITDDILKPLPDQLKFTMAGYSILTEYGDRTFNGVFSTLKRYLDGRV